MKILAVLQITAVYTRVYLIPLLVLPWLLITVLCRNDNSSLSRSQSGKTASGLIEGFPFCVPTPPKKATIKSNNPSGEKMIL